MISLKDISTICGLSVSTVSRALRDYSDISMETKQYVQSVADRIGYSCARENREKKKEKQAKRSRCIGLICRQTGQGGTLPGMGIQVLRAVREKAFERGYDVMLIRGGEDCKGKLSWLACARFHALEGVIVLGSTTEMYTPEAMDLAASEIPAVIVGPSFEGNSCINIDFASGMDSLMKEVYRHGYRRIAFICPKSGRDAAIRRAVYLRNILHTGFISLPEHLIMSDRCDREEIGFYTKSLIHSRSCPECILYPDDISAIWGMEALREEGIRVPDDIGVTGFGGTARCFGLGSALTTWNIDCQEIGNAAASDLFDRIENPELFLPGTRYVRGNLLAGMTIRPVRQESTVSG